MRNPGPQTEQPLRGGTLFSGIGSPELAAPWIDWRWCAEIEPFASAVLAARFPGSANLGDVRSLPDAAIEPVDLIAFGSPCQSFSVAGKRAGLDDARGNLALVGLRIVERVRPRWVVFENVPGLLSSGDGRDFGAILGTLGQCGYGFAYRILDAQYFGVAQRRRRVFVVGYLGDWRPAAAVLFERESLRGDSPPGREAGQDIAATLTRCADTGTGLEGGAALIAFGGGRQSGALDVATTLNASCRIDFETETLTLAVRGRGDAADLEFRGDGIANAVLAPGGGRGGTGVGAIAGAMSVRRLTPRECERLQGFPDDFTLIDYRGKPAADGPRYRVLGNAMAAPVIGWILDRVKAVPRHMRER